METAHASRLLTAVASNTRMDLSNYVSVLPPVATDLAAKVCELIGADPRALLDTGLVSKTQTHINSPYSRHRQLAMLVSGCEIKLEDYFLIVHSSPSQHWQQFCESQFILKTSLASEYNAFLDLMDNAAFQCWALTATAEHYGWTVGFVEAKAMAHRKRDHFRYNPDRLHPLTYLFAKLTHSIALCCIVLLCCVVLHCRPTNIVHVCQCSRSAKLKHAVAGGSTQITLYALTRLWTRICSRSYMQCQRAL